MVIQVQVALALLAGGGARLDPGRTIEVFLRAVEQADTSAALDLISGDAFEMVDSLLSSDPERLRYLAEGFGVVLEPGSLQGLGPRGFMGAVLSSPALAGMLSIASWEVAGFEEDGDCAVVTVGYRLLRAGGTLDVSLVREEGVWHLDDYFGGAPMR